VVEMGKDFVVQFPSSEKLKMMMEFDEFKLKGMNAYIKVTHVSKKVVPVGRSFSVWARANGVPDESKHYKAICEVGSLIGVVDDVDMQILADSEVVRFQADVMNVNKFPKVRRYVVKPFAYDITFSIERIIEKGTIMDNMIVPMDIDLGGPDKSGEKSSRDDDDDEAARTAKKLKASDSGTSNT
jgi:hypothetical protein